MKQIWTRLKPYLRWVILGGTLFFLAQAFKQNWQEVAAIRINAASWATLAIALGVTLLAHTWAGWVWTWILRDLNQPVSTSEFVQVYLKTNLAKYLPGNVWHYYGRVSAATSFGVSFSAATLSVLLEPLLMAAAAIGIVLLAAQPVKILPILGLASVLIAVHPRFLNIAIRYLGSLKKGAGLDSSQSLVKRYPLVPLLGELGFLGLRGTGFLLTVLAFQPVELSEIPLLLEAFSLSWLLGLIVPGAPGGVGVFEVTAIAILNQSFAPAIVISAIAFYRLISILAEAGGAGLAYLVLILKNLF